MFVYNIYLSVYVAMALSGSGYTFSILSTGVATRRHCRLEPTLFLESQNIKVPKMQYKFKAKRVRGEHSHILT